MPPLRIAIGSDHAGFEGATPYKPALMAHLAGLGFDVVNCGTDTADAVDYPDVAERVCEKVLRGEADLGMLVCGTGTGMAITANRHRGIRAAVCCMPKMARLAREHNHANVLCLGTRLVPLDDAKAIVEAFVNEPVSTVDRHRRRVEKMDRTGGGVAR